MNFLSARCDSGPEILLLGRAGSDPDVTIFNTQEATWSKALLPPRGDGRQSHSACVLGERIVIFGGFTGSHWIDQLDILDLRQLERQGEEPQALEAQRCLATERGAPTPEA